MRSETVQVIAALLSPCAFVLAFIGAGVVLMSSLFMALIGAIALSWLVYTIAKRMLLHRSERNAT
jgi:hypothetical protein